ncbi:protochlorophyllide-dependent translocon component 52, chloroplastic-like protein [Corchorus olitorius]|uniref:Protochlorophyllide-dependent translocon component 52, chloroplastic-like protein n=1 Tax=Corchorus olitorius TaxID=93759 RepID=A0A1R3GIH4_9ROSI|nr:protochlorophyllide-dependent translocon component 52, chloroplastic-like protein [Corchorus olitorius]
MDVLRGSSAIVPSPYSNPTTPINKTQFFTKPLTPQNLLFKPLIYKITSKSKLFTALSSNPATTESMEEPKPPEPEVQVESGKEKFDCWHYYLLLTSTIEYIRLKYKVHTFKKACVAVYPSTVQYDIVWRWPNTDPQYKDIIMKKKPPYIAELEDPSFTKAIGNRDIPYGNKAECNVNGG